MLLGLSSFGVVRSVALGCLGMWVLLFVYVDVTVIIVVLVFIVCVGEVGLLKVVSVNHSGSGLGCWVWG